MRTRGRTAEITPLQPIARNDIETNQEEPASLPHNQRHFDLKLANLLVVVSVVTLIYGWHYTWPDLNRDFNHLHGWGECQDGHLARNIAEEGLLKLGLAPVAFKFFDAGDHYWYYTHYPILPHAILSLVFHVVSPASEHRALRLASMAMTLLFLCGLYLLGRELHGASFAAWALFFAAVNAQSFFFGAFEPMGSLAILCAAFAYWSYLRWRRTGTRLPLVLCATSLLGGYLSSYFFYPASLPMAVDLFYCHPHRTQRRTLAAASLILLPVVLFISIQLYYQHGVALLTGKEVFTTGAAQNLAHRTHYELLLSFGFYQRVLQELLWYLSPPMVIGAAAYYAARVSLLAVAWRTRPLARRWKDVFIILTVALAACLFLFPQSTLDHQMTYLFAILPLSLAGAAAVYRLRSYAVTTLVIAATIVTAFAGSDSFKAMNNSPQWEFKTGVALSLFTPPGSFVQTVINPNYYFMLLYYAHRNLLFNVIEQLRPAGVPIRFDLSFGSPAPPNACALLVAGTDAVIVDRAPHLRPKLLPVHTTYGSGAYEIVAARVTGTFENMHVVEIGWRQTRSSSESLGFDVGQVVRGQFVSLGRLKPSAGCLDASENHGGPVHREAYFVETQHNEDSMLMRVVHLQSGRYLESDAGRVDIELQE